MEPDSTPVPEPRGSLVPPARRPPTAIAIATPEPPRPPIVRGTRQAGMPAFLRFVRETVNVVLDIADDVADSLAGALGVRERTDKRSGRD